MVVPIAAKKVTFGVCWFGVGERKVCMTVTLSRVTMELCVMVIKCESIVHLFALKYLHVKVYVIVSYDVLTVFTDRRTLTFAHFL